MVRFLLGGLFALILCGACASSSTRESSAHELPGASSGAPIYIQLCASCHGEAGQGNGPVAAQIESGVPDLTRIAQRNGGVFPQEQVRRTIDGRWDRRAHGAREMPVWGRRLYYSAKQDDPAERARVDERIGALVDYLRSIQVK